MRIIAGKARSLPLKTAPGQETRPTTDRIKETLFNMIQKRLPGCVFLDLFAGSGGIGLEAISRGASQAVFVERNRKAAACIQENVNFTRFQEQSSLLCMDVSAALLRLEGQYRFDVIFMDPPYNQEWEKRVLEQLSSSALVTDETLMIVEASQETDFSYLEELGYELVKIKRYKKNEHVFIQKKKG